MGKKNDLYINAPLIETVFEIRFPGNPTIECNRDKFYNKIKNRYPSVFVPKVSEGKAIALEPYQFDSVDKTQGVLVALNKLALSCKKYEGFIQFKKEVMRVFSIFGKLYPIHKLNRIGLRYVNVIPFSREKNIIPITKYLNVDINLSNQIHNNFQNFATVFVSPASRGNITTRIESIVSENKTKEGILLDFDYARVENLHFHEIDNYLNESHQYTKKLFEGLISENYKKIMRGEAI